MTDLLTLAREYDLPPRWDGHAVVWKPWETPIAMQICPPPRADVCGRPAVRHGQPQQSRVVGLVANSTVLTHADYAAEEARRDALPELIRHKIKRRWWRRLVATRCHWCDHDQVTDLHTREVWDLDHTDYGPNGSRRPT